MGLRVEYWVGYDARGTGRGGISAGTHKLLRRGSGIGAKRGGDVSADTERTRVAEPVAIICSGRKLLTRDEAFRFLSLGICERRKRRNKPD